MSAVPLKNVLKNSNRLTLFREFDKTPHRLPTALLIKASPNLC